MHVILQEEFRKIVKDELKRQGVNQSELARRMNVSPVTVSQYLSGKIVPGVDMVERFFKALNIPVGFSALHSSGHKASA